MLKLNNQCQLSIRELDILLLLAMGKSNRQIADELCLTVRTVKFHTCNIYGKIGVLSRSEAIVWSWQHLQVQAMFESRWKNCTKVQT